MNITAVACMKNEGPFVLEWLAHHRAIGINRFIIFSNDCNDGTDELLDVLDDAGEIRHLENPSYLSQSDRRIDVAFDYARHLKEYKRADYVALIDADEFINVKTRHGYLPRLLKQLGDLDVLSFNHVNFGFSGVVSFDEGFVTDQFFQTSGEQDGQGERVRTAIKSLHRNAPGLRPANHFPQVAPGVLGNLRWFDGAGNTLRTSANKPRRKMLRCEGRTDLVQLNHYAVRSVESFLVKHDRGNVFGGGQWDPMLYAAEYNHNRVEDRSILATRAQRLAEYERLMSVPKIARKSRACMAHHKSRIAEITGTQEGQRLCAELGPLSMTM